MLDLVRVVASHPEANCVDVVSLASGRRMAGVQVLSSAAGSAHGLHDLPMPEEQAQGGDPFEAPGSEERVTLAVVAAYAGIPVVMGFLFPAVSQLLFAERDRLVHRHASDLYWTADRHGNCELAHPSGTYLRIGTSPAHEDLSGKDADQRWAITRNTDKQVHVQLTLASGGAVKASLHIDPAGNVELTHSGSLTVTTSGTADVTAGGSATVKAPSVTVDTPSATCTGALLVKGKITGQGGLAISGGGGGAAATIAGTMTVSGGDVTADGISLKSHVHREQGDGGLVSAPQ